MALTPRLELRQGHALVMTPQLQQSIKLLQLNNFELMAFVEQELEQNPFLEHDEGGAEADSETPDDAPTPVADGDPVASDRALKISEDMPNGRDLADLDVREEDLWRGEEGTSGPTLAGASYGGAVGGGDTRFGSGDSSEGSAIEQTPSLPGTLRDHLISQLGMEVASPGDRLIGSHLIELIDDAGYIAADLHPVSEKLGCDVSRVERTLAQLQRFDPPGVFARNLAECLALQLKDRDRFDPAMAALVDNLDLLAQGEMSRLMKLCGIDAEDLTDMVAEIKSLNPKPGLAFDTELVQPIVPDVFIRPTSDGGWSVELNTDTLPQVMVNSSYYTELSSASPKGQEKQFISSCFQTANWLVRSLDQRARTILKVATELVRQQEPFFSRGVQHLRPLTLRTIAEAIDMHESTVSRVSNNKYVSTPRGTYEIKFFFSASLGSTTGGESHAAEAVRHRIKALIDAEAQSNILSDDRIAGILSQAGIDIARRTVAKYREAMHIPSSVRRRREKERLAIG